MKGIIIDDEPMAREDLNHLLAAHPDMSIIGEAGTVSQAEKMLAKLDPDVVFLDIQLIGGSGFDLVPLIPPTTRIIFFTSYNEYAVRAFEVNALDYLLKPVSAERLAGSLARLRATKKEQPAFAPTTESLQEDDRVYICADGIQCFVPVRDVVAVTAAGGNYTFVYLKGGSEYTVRRTMKEWEETLPQEMFLRIHRSAIIGLNCIASMRPAKNGTYQAYIAGIEEPFTVSRRMVLRLQEFISE